MALSPGCFLHHAQSSCLLTSTLRFLSGASTAEQVLGICPSGAWVGGALAIDPAREGSPRVARRLDGLPPPRSACSRDDRPSMRLLRDRGSKTCGPYTPREGGRQEIFAPEIFAPVYSHPICGLAARRSRDMRGVRSGGAERHDRVSRLKRFRFLGETAIVTGSRPP